MQSFTDTAGRTWELSLNVYLVKKVKEQTGRLLTSLADNNCALLIELHENCELLVDVLWCLCHKQAAALGVVDDEESQATEKFAMGLGGESLADASEALVGAITDFFSSQGQRDALRKLTQKAKELDAVIGKAIVAKLDAIDLTSMDPDSIVSVLNSLPSLDKHPGSTASVS